MDNYLIYLVQSYNKEALKLLIEKYRKSVFIWAQEIIGARTLYREYDVGLIKNDVEMVLYKAIETYDSSKGIFYTYLKGAVHNVIMNYLRTNRRSINNAISLDYEIDEDIVLLDSISSCDNISRIEERLYMMEDFKLLEEKFEILKETACSIFGDESLLLDVEKQVLSLKIMGYSIAEISRKLKINRKKVEYIIKI